MTVTLLMGGVKITINVPEEIIEELFHFRRKLLY